MNAGGIDDDDHSLGSHLPPGMYVYLYVNK
jgi:hypothetical protein